MGKAFNNYSGDSYDVFSSPGVTPGTGVVVNETNALETFKHI
ncbi:hypothetical protein [Gottfriedia sp. OAE603]